MVNSHPPRQRFILLGASNATIGFPTVVDSARRRAGEPLEIMAATALGRSFGKKTKIFFRAIDGILDSALWSDLRERPALPTRALVTDIGNDILYGEPIERIVDWVSTCVQRLRDCGAEVALSQLPIGSLSKLGTLRFRLFRKIFFPGCRLSLAEARQRASELNERVLEIANQHKIQAISHVPAWYGFDPIHVLKRYRSAAWNEFLNPLFRNQNAAQEKLGSRSQAAYLFALAPAERWIMGMRRRRNQPSGTLRDGTTISLY